MAFTLTCSGDITVDVDYKPECVDGWIVEPVNTGYMTVEDFSDLWPSIILLFVVAFGIKLVIRTVSQNAGRN